MPIPSAKAKIARAVTKRLWVTTRSYEAEVLDEPRGPETEEVWVCVRYPSSPNASSINSTASRPARSSTAAMSNRTGRSSSSLRAR